MSNTIREILFRGKSIDTGEWVYGAYGNHTSLDAMIIDRPYITSNSDLSALNLWAVDPNTVGQYTGLTGKNGTKIFEGDIVKHYNCTADSTMFDIGLIFWDTNKCRFVRTGKDGDDIYEIWQKYMNDYEVIGNIHDNPELLKDTKKR